MDSSSSSFGANKKALSCVVEFARDPWENDIWVSLLGSITVPGPSAKSKVLKAMAVAQAGECFLRVEERFHVWEKGKSALLVFDLGMPVG